MYIRKVTHAHKKNQREYRTYKLVESLRTERGPRQRTLLNLGADFTFPEKKWKDLANRIEGIITGQDPLFAYPEEIETIARRYARKVIRYQGQFVLRKRGVHSAGSPGVDEPDYHRVDINTLENEHPRPVGAEYVIHETIKELELDKKACCPSDSISLPLTPQLGRGICRPPGCPFLRESRACVASENDGHR